MEREGESFYVDALRRWMMMIIIINVIIIIINIFVSRSETLITFGKQKQVGKCINVRTKKTLEKRMHNKKKLDGENDCELTTSPLFSVNISQLEVDESQSAAQ